MKDYNAMVESLFERREKYQEERTKKIRSFRKAASIISCCCLVMLVGVGIFKSNLFFEDPNIFGEKEESNGSDQYSCTESGNSEGKNGLNYEKNLQEEADRKESDGVGSIYDSSSDLEVMEHRNFTQDNMWIKMVIL